MQDLITLFFGTTIGIVFVFSIVSLVLLIISIKVFDYFHDMSTLIVYVNTNGFYLPYVSDAISKVCEKYNAIVVATQIIREPSTNPHLKHMQFTIVCYTRDFKHIKEDLGQCILCKLNQLKYTIEER